MGPQVRGKEYEIVFDHMHDESIPDHPSYDMDEQPTVVLIDDIEQRNHQPVAKTNHHSQIQKHKSKERNASLLNSSALSRD